jgi:lysine decarboxylase
MSPREAYFSLHVSVPRAQALGRVSAELVAPYPPGVPVLVPGEEITAATMAALDRALEAGTRIAYAAEPTLACLQVVQDASPGSAAGR